MKTFTLKNKENFKKTVIDKFITTSINEIKNTTYINLSIINNDEKISTETFNSVLKFIDSQGSKKIKFCFQDEEPTLHRQLKPFIRKLRKKYDKKIEIIVNTNLMKTTSYYKNFPEYVKFLCSINTEYVNNHKTCMNTAISLFKRGQVIKVILMLTKNNMNDVIQLYKKYEDMLHMEIEPIGQFRFTENYKNFYDAYKYQEKYDYGLQLPDISINGKKYNKVPTFRVFGNFKDCFCNAGFDITTDGDVYKCKGKNQEVLFNVNDITLEYHLIRDKWSICKDVDCPGDGLFSRLSELEFVKEFVKIKK